jgi:MFS family permease
LSHLTTGRHGLRTDDRKQLRRAVIMSTVSTTIEWYDFFLYSTVTGLAFAQLYFPKLDPLVGTLQAFGIYDVGFVARPVGAAIFGHYGDRIGRLQACFRRSIGGFYRQATDRLTKVHSGLATDLCHPARFLLSMVSEARHQSAAC